MTSFNSGGVREKVGLAFGQWNLNIGGYSSWCLMRQKLMLFESDVNKPFSDPIQKRCPYIWFCLFLLFPSRTESSFKLIL